MSGRMEFFTRSPAAVRMGETGRITRVKICGLTRMEDIDCVNECGPEYIGFVFAKKSRRYLSPEKAAELRARLAPGIIPVGVFVNEDPELIAKLLSEHVIEAAQLHGKETRQDIALLRTLTDRPVIKAFRIDDENDVEQAGRSRADLILADHGDGGTGETLDWKLLQCLNRPFVLAGGLTPGNAAEAVRLLHPFAVDVSSGVETGGWKDPEKIRSFIQAVRGVEQNPADSGRK